MPSFTSEEF